MRLRKVTSALVVASALSAASFTQVSAWAEDVSVNLDALGPEPAKKPTKPSKPMAPDAVKSDIVPDPVPMRIAPKKPLAQPKLTAKPAEFETAPVTPVAVAKPEQSGEIDFIGRTKNAQGVDKAPKPSPASIAEPTKPKTATTPVMATPIPDETPPPAAPPAAAVVTAPVQTAPTPSPMKVSPPKPKQPPAKVVVNSGGLDTDPQSDGKPKGTPLTAIQPDGALFVPQNTDALPQPVAVPQSALPDAVDGGEEPAPSPLTLPPAMPDAPVQSSPPVVPAAPVRPSAAVQPSAKTAPPSTQTIAAATKPQAPAPTRDRASVLSGHATAVELKFDQGQDVLTAEAQSALDQIAEPLKSTGLRVQLAAYSGAPGNNSSDARRLSLKRALAVRDYLGSRGIPKLSVNIAAFGGAVQGETDRVDLMVRSDQASRLNAPQ